MHAQVSTAGRASSGSASRGAALCAVALGAALACAAARAQPAHLPATGAPTPADSAARPLTVRLPSTTMARTAGYPGVQVSATVDKSSDDQQPAADRLPPLAEPIGPGQKQSADGVTLDRITEVALANSPIIREARNKWIAARGKALQASFYPNPSFGTYAPQIAGNQSQYAVTVSQLLVTKGKIRLDTAAALRDAMAAEMALIRARFDLLTMVRQRFYTALAMQRRVEVLEQMVDIARHSRDIADRLLKAGVGPRSDVLLLQIELSKAEAELKNAHTFYETSRRELAAATGVINLPIPRIAGDLYEPLPDYELIATQQGVLERNSLVRGAEFDIAASRYRLRRQEVEPFPNLSMLGGYQHQLPGNGYPLDQGLYTFDAVIPLYNQNQGNIRAAQATISASVAAYNRVRTELANQTALAIGRYITARQFANRYQNEILPAAFEVQRITQRLYNQGQVEFLRYLASQTALLQAALANIDAQEQRWTAGAEVAGLLQSPQFP